MATSVSYWIVTPVLAWVATEELNYFQNTFLNALLPFLKSLVLDLLKGLIQLYLYMVQDLLWCYCTIHLFQVLASTTLSTA